MKRVAEILGRPQRPPVSGLPETRPEAAKLVRFVDEPPIQLSTGSAGGYRIAVCLPSRGLVFSRVIESVLREVASVSNLHQLALFMVHGETIPEAQSQLVTRAMSWGCDFTWMVEEDNYMPQGVLKAMLDQRACITSCDYFSHEGVTWVLHDPIGPMQVYAFGCTLIHREVWEAIEFPYMFAGHPISVGPDGEPYEEERTWEYGGQDMNFSFRAYKLGFRGTRLDGSRWRSPHLRCTQFGARRSRNGDVHEIAVS